MYDRIHLDSYRRESVLLSSLSSIHLYVKNNICTWRIIVLWNVTWKWEHDRKRKSIKYVFVFLARKTKYPYIFILYTEILYFSFMKNKYRTSGFCGVDPTNNDGWCLRYSSACNQYEIVKVLLEYGVDPTRYGLREFDPRGSYEARTASPWTWCEIGRGVTIVEDVAGDQKRDQKCTERYSKNMALVCSIVNHTQWLKVLNSMRTKPTRACVYEPFIASLVH
jgi:hypothetical protein